MNKNPATDFERWPGNEPLDETDINLRAYVSRLPAEKLAQYDPNWTDEQVVAWDGNFRSDDALMLVCCERDVGVREFRDVVEGYLKYTLGKPARETSSGQDVRPL